ncbi:MAG TPA: hypothetical protein VIU61_26680 [Kofleriaceae bacterium]
MKRVETRRATARNRQITRPLDRPPERQRLATPPGSFVVPVTRGSVDAADWLRARGLSCAQPHWFVEVGLDVVDEPAGQVWNGAIDSRFHLYVYPEEWGFFFCHGSRSSWIRVADAVRVHGADDYALTSHTPPLRDLYPFLRGLEQQHRISFRRDHALIRTNIDGAEEAVRAWLATL